MCIELKSTNDSLKGVNICCAVGVKGVIVECDMTEADKSQSIIQAETNSVCELRRNLGKQLQTGHLGF